MPKIKTKSGAKKRFKVTGTGKMLYAQRGIVGSSPAHLPRSSSGGNLAHALRALPGLEA